MFPAQDPSYSHNRKGGSIMEDQHLHDIHRPTVGMRNIKTAIATALCVLIYYFFRRSPAFACIGAIFGMGSDLSSSKLNGGNRLFGTIIGGLLGMVLYSIYLFFFPDGEMSLLLVPLMFIGTIILIILCQHIWVGGIQPGGVVLCIILFNTPAESYVAYALNRIFDTAFGVLIALMVNSAFPGGFTFHFMERIYTFLHKGEKGSSQPEE